jgi:hypothetical protein
MVNLHLEATKIQRWFRGCIYRIKHLPLILFKIKKHLLSQIFQFSIQNKDGRINSSIDEDGLIEILIEKFGERIKKPKFRMWYDILVFDYLYGWIPVNIKTTTTYTSDNTGNLAMCVYAYTDELLDIHSIKSYQNGMMSELLHYKLKTKKYNKLHKKDYYFLVLNKTDSSDIIINSVKGLVVLTPNINNLPFQVCWNKNRFFTYKKINRRVEQLIICLQKPMPSWREKFLSDIILLDL